MLSNPRGSAAAAQPVRVRFLGSDLSRTRSQGSARRQSPFPEDEAESANFGHTAGVFGDRCRALFLLSHSSPPSSASTRKKSKLGVGSDSGTSLSCPFGMAESIPEKTGRNHDRAIALRSAPLARAQRRGWVRVGGVPADQRSEGIGFLSCRRVGEGVRKGAERKGLERLKKVREQQNLREL